MHTTLIRLLTLPALIAALAFAQPAHADDDFDITGVVMSAPAGGGAWGVWEIEQEGSGAPWSVTAVEGSTEIRNGVAAVGERVRVVGEIDDDGPEAERIERLDDDDNGPGDDDGPGHGPGDDHDGDRHRDGDLNGILRERPAGAVGLWQIECEPQLICEVTVSADTRIDDPLDAFVPGVWVEADGLRQGATFVAERVRLDEAEQQELVVGFVPTADDVTRAAFADDYELTPITTVLKSGNIYLYSTEEDEEDEVVELAQAIESGAETRARWVELNTVLSAPSGDGYKTWRWGGESEDGYINQAAFSQVGLEAAHYESRGAGITVAVLDTGLLLTHPAFAGRLAPASAHYDFVADDADPTDQGPGFGWGHGTHIAGIVARMAPEARILPLRVLDANGRGNTFALAAAIDRAVAQGADVINLSLGAERASRVLRESIAAAQAQGVIIVAAAGNEGRAQPRQIPAALEGVIGVGAVDAQNRRWSLSNYGDWVDLAAPGVGITSTVPFSGGVGYAAWSGTSMATGFVSGAAALLLADESASSASATGVAPLMTPEEVLARLTATATPLPGQGIGGALHTARLVGLTHEAWLPQVSD